MESVRQIDSRADIVNLGPDPSQIATQNFSSECILERYLEQHIKNAPESTLGKCAEFAKNAVYAN